MNSGTLGTRVGSAAFAVGLGLAIATNPAVAIADETDSGSSAQSTSTHTGRSAAGRTSRQAGHASEARRANGAGATKAGGPSAAAARQPAPPAVAVRQPAPAATARAAVAPAVDNPVDSTASFREAVSAPAPSVAAVPTSAGAIAAPAVAATQRVRPTGVFSGLLNMLGFAPAGGGTGAPFSPAQLVTGVLSLIGREIEALFGTPQPTTPVATTLALATASTGTTTKITWRWGTYPVINFNPATDKLDFGWMKPSAFTVTETAGSTVIAIVDNNHAYTLNNVTVSQLQMSNIIAKDPGTVATWQNLIANAKNTVPTVSIADASLTEGNTGSSTMSFAVSLSKASANPVSVSYATSNGTATAGQDYVSSSGTITFAAGVSSQVINVSVLGDTTVEPTETFSVTLSNPSGATISDASAVGTIINNDAATQPGTAQWGKAFFAPYVDMTLTATPNLLQYSQATGDSLMTLAFIQADSNGVAAWAGNAALELNSTNAQAQAINQSITTFKAAGGDVSISFGGPLGTSLAQSYSAKGRSAQALADAYAAVVDKYQVTHIDFDIEGAAMTDSASIALQSQALKLLQQAKPDIQIWYTLPVLPTGFTTAGRNVVTAALKAGVQLAGVNVMALDYGTSAAPTSGPNAKTMGAYAVAAANASYTQLASLYSTYGRIFGWSQLGVTPMLGVNDITDEVFTLADAQILEDFARSKNLGMLSMWSVNRDTPGTLGQATPTASGLSDPAGSFSKVFNDYGTVNVVYYGGTAIAV